MWAGVVRQSVKHSLGTSWTRLWAGFWWLATLIITTGYTSNLVAFLTVPVYPKRIETVDQLAASKLRWVDRQMDSQVGTHIYTQKEREGEKEEGLNR